MSKLLLLYSWPIFLILALPSCAPSEIAGTKQVLVRSQQQPHPDMRFPDATILIPIEATLKGEKYVDLGPGLGWTINSGVYSDLKVLKADYEADVKENGAPKNLASWQYWIDESTNSGTEFVSVQAYRGSEYLMLTGRFPSKQESSKELLLAALQLILKSWKVVE